MGEDSDGIWTRVHPVALLEREPQELDAVIRQFIGTSDRELRPDDYTRRPAWWRTLWIAMLGAKVRADKEDAEEQVLEARRRAAKAREEAEDG